jgi:hypothetical protein
MDHERAERLRELELEVLQKAEAFADVRYQAAPEPTSTPEAAAAEFELRVAVANLRTARA